MQVLAALCFLVLAHLAPLRGEVVESFKNGPYCLNFFYEGKPPKWDVPKRHTVCICQRLNNRYHFATLYNTANRIPVYSAYRFETGNDKGRQDRWYIEPQLENSNWNASMMDEWTLKQEHNATFGESQALEEDYKDSIYTHGHLNPNGHHSGDSRNATFTLTNVVPQKSNLNGKWSVYETDLQKTLKNCLQAYVLVGAIPSTNKTINERVNIPDRIWNAYCCLDNNGQLHSGGAIALNADETRVRKHTLSELEKLLSPPVGQLFHNNCGA